MIRKLFMILLLLFMTLGEARKSFLSFLNIEKTKILFFTKTEEAIIVRSSYKDKQANFSHLFVQTEDPKILQAVNVTKTSSDVTNFTINLVTDQEGETNLTIQLWVPEGHLTSVLDFGHYGNTHVMVPDLRRVNILRAIE
ncbi:PREDICTED: sodium/bile acid cotransporter 5 [Chinchilla lanigera]|uniref:sodium/bile acid cotransporter 5 n=1 Tax=Chinchilla lanigera TaxID=34839 RepID=UPI00038EFE73|nr:PREDICTED: sodium/bile acid cotransporter 5 [Chinchilla lanigera]